jgi:hypothetical protein
MCRGIILVSLVVAAVGYVVEIWLAATKHLLH